MKELTRCIAIEIDDPVTEAQKRVGSLDNVERSLFSGAREGGKAVVGYDAVVAHSVRVIQLPDW